MKKILFVLHIPPPIHGSSIVGLQIKESVLINSSFDCQFINLSTSNSIASIGSINLSKFLSYLSIIVKIIKSSFKNSFDIVYIAPTVSNLGFLKDFFVVVIIKLLNNKVVFHLHNKGVSKRKKGIIIDFLYRIFFKNTKVILLSELLYDDIKEFVDKKNIFICPNGIDKITGLENELNSKKKNEIPHFLFLSNLIKSKGVTDLIEACAILKKRDIKFKCNFIGGEADISKELFDELKSKYNLVSEIEFFGKKYGIEKHQFFLNADIFVFPTYFETFGIVLIEAMQYALPIITTDEGGIPNIVKNKKNGLIVEKNNPEDIANKLEELLNDKEKMKKIGYEGRRVFFEKFTSDIFERKMLVILKEVSA